MSIRCCRRRAAIAALGAIAFSVATLSAPASAATFKVVAADLAGDGFNDLTPRAPVGGNPGTTLGAQRLNVVRYAASLWGVLLHSDVTIRLGVDFALFDASDCQSASALLGYAGPAAAFANFAGAPRPDTMYPSALADSLAGTDLNPGGVDISAVLNQSIDEGCFSLGAPEGWYYGYDNRPPPGTIDLLQTVLHELVHGLGFSSFVTAEGRRCCSNRPMDDAFMVNLEWHDIGVTWPFLTDEERALSSRSVDGLHWVGPNVQAAGSYLGTGRTGTHVHMHAPAVYEPGASVSHFSSTLSPRELLQPSLGTAPLRLLSLAALQDIGWVILGASTPTPVPTPTATPAMSPSPSPTAVQPAASATATATAVDTPEPTAIVQATPTVRRGCSLDCDEDGLVTIDEVQTIAAIYLEMRGLAVCPNADAGGDGKVSIQEVQLAANEYLGACPP